MLSKIQIYDIWKMLFKSPPPPKSYQVVKEGGNRQILDVVRVVYSGLCMVGESVKVLKLSLIRFNC